MLNKRPIFINSFARGGSNIVWEILQSHQDVVAPMEETDKIIWQKAGNAKTVVNIWLTLLNGNIFPSIKHVSNYYFFNYGTFHANNLIERSLNKRSQSYLDKLLYEWKFKNLEHPFNKYKTKDNIYSEEEIRNSRVAAKHINGLIYLVPALFKMYPDSVHFGLVRNGLALCESRLRRGTFKDAGKFGIIYNNIVNKFLQYSERYEHFYLLRFEDLLNEPKQFVSNLYNKAGLNYNDKINLRLKAKKIINQKGEHTTQLKEGDKYWLNINDFFSFVKKDINDMQISKMKDEDKSLFLKYAGEAMHKLGY